MNTRFAHAVFLVLCGVATLAAASGNNPGAGHDASAAPTRSAQDDAQRRRAELRAALQAQQNADNAKQTARQLSQQDRAELRQQLRQQRQIGQHP